MELIVAMMVFSILSVMAYAGLQSMITSKTHTEKVAKRLVDLQTTFMFIGRDIEQTVGRSVRDGFGDVRPAMQGGEFGNELISLTRAGYVNVLKATRSNLQRVTYRFEDNVLTRVSWPMLDQDFNDEVYERVLLDKVEKVSLSYVDQAGEAQDQWPPSFGIDEDKKSTLLPRAVIIKMETEAMGEIRRVFRVPPGESIMSNSALNP